MSYAIDETAVPGTMHLVDVQGVLRDKHAKGRNHDVILVPTPSKDPNDPLNWSPWRKRTATACVLMYTIVIALGTTTIFSILEPLSKAHNLSIATLNNAFGYQYLTQGWGCLFWQPIALQYGKRPVYLVSILGNLGCCMWAPYTTSSGEWIGSKLVQGFFAAPIEALVEISIADVYFSHERGTYVAQYAMALMAASNLAPFFSGFIADSMGWRWVMYWSAIWFAIGFLFCFFLMEETNYDRPAAETESHVTTADEQSAHATDPTEKSTVAGNADVDADVDAGSSRDGEVYQLKPYWQKLALFDKPRPMNLYPMMYRPLVFLTFPVIFWSGFTYGTAVMWYSVFSGTTSLILSNAPYSFSTSAVGCSYLAPVVGTVFGFFYTGFFGDRVVLWQARRNNGIWHAEYRLWLFVANMVLVPFSCLLWGVGAYYEIHWFGLVFSEATINFTIVVGVQLCISYCIDSYKALGGEAIVAVVLVRNTLLFAVSYGITPWVTNLNYKAAFIIAAVAGFAQVSTFLLMVWFGPAMRASSKTRYYKYVKQNADRGIGAH